MVANADGIISHHSLPIRLYQVKLHDTLTNWRLRAKHHSAGLQKFEWQFTLKDKTKSFVCCSCVWFWLELIERLISRLEPKNKNQFRSCLFFFADWKKVSRWDETKAWPFEVQRIRNERWDLGEKNTLPVFGRWFPSAGRKWTFIFLLKLDLYTFDESEQKGIETYHEVCEAYYQLFSTLGVNFVQGLLFFAKFHKSHILSSLDFNGLLQFIQPSSQVMIFIRHDKLCASFNKPFLPFCFWFEVEGDTGLMGGKLSHEFHILSDIGEDSLLICEK